MNNNKIIVGFIVVAIVLGITGLFSINGNLKQIASKVSESAKQTFSAISSPDIPSLWLRWGGVLTQNGHMDFAQATTTVCAIQSPSSTSTLVFASVGATVSSTTPTLWTMAKATTAFATTTVLATSTSIANAQVWFNSASTTALASTTNSSGTTVNNFTIKLLELSDRIFAPNTWLVVSATDMSAENTAGTYSSTGGCNASWIKM